MNTKKDIAEDSIVDFIDDDKYYEIKKDKQQIENAMWGIYIFAVVSLLFYIFYLLINHADFDWINFALNVILIAIYFCLGAYSSYKPFTAFAATLCVLAIIFLLEIFLTSQFNLRGLIIKSILIVYISMRLEAAKKVQQYESKHLK